MIKAVLTEKLKAFLLLSERLVLLKNPEATIEEAVYASQELPGDALPRLIDYFRNTQKIFK